MIFREEITFQAGILLKTQRNARTGQHARMTSARFDSRSPSRYIYLISIFRRTC